MTRTPDPIFPPHVHPSVREGIENVTKRLNTGNISIAPVSGASADDADVGDIRLLDDGSTFKIEVYTSAGWKSVTVS